MAYLGQASYLPRLRHHPLDASHTFFNAIKGPVYMPAFPVVILAAIIASPSITSETFSVLQQSLSPGCFPRIKVVHTSSKYEGQVYIPEVNFILVLTCVCITFGFRATEKIDNAME
ncbi:hypothetical protein Droror1_Dr00007903 [Drosera rotundifolia]